MTILSSSFFIVTAWAVVWLFLSVYDFFRLKNAITHEQRMIVSDERIPVWAWIGGLIIFWFMFVLVPFVGAAAGLQ